MTRLRDLVRQRRTAALVLLALALGGAIFSGADFVSSSSNATNTFSASDDFVAPTVTSIDRSTSSPTKLTSVQWDVTFNESVTGVDKADFKLAAAGGVTGTSITSVTGSGSSYTVTADAGAGEGTLGLNLVDDDSIQDGDSNTLGGTGTTGAGDGSFTGQVYSIDRTTPTKTALEMFDTNGNGKVDQVKVTFDETLASSTDTAPWTLTNVPSGGALSSVSTSGSVATLTLTEGAGAADTSVGTFKVALAQSATGIRDAADNRSSFAAASPTDKAAPVVVSLARKTASPTNLTSLDWTATFSETVTGVNTNGVDFSLVAGGGVTGASITSASSGTSVYTVTASAGSNNGTLGLNLVDDDSIKDAATNTLGGTGTANGNFTGEVYTIDRTAPARTALEMFDTNGNGKIDQVKVTFDETLQNSTATTGWTLSSVPSGGTLASVSTSGSVATLTLNEGAGAANTAVGSFTVALSASTGDIKDGAGNKSGFAAAAPTDKAAPVVVSLNRVTASPTNLASPQWSAIFSETVTGVGTSDFALVQAGGVSGASITTVGAGTTTYTVTVNSGTGDGTLGLNLADDDSIVDTPGNKLGGTGTGNGDFTGQVYTIDKTKPTMTKLEMFDSNGNGKVDQVKATFNETLANTTSTTGWSVANAPSGSNTISSLSTSGSVATLNLTEGATVNTAVGTFTVSLNATNNTTDTANNSANSFSGQTPQDKAAPVVVSLARKTASPTTLTSLQWDLTLSESVTGVDNGDFSLVPGGSVTGASITSTSGSGSAYTITVNAGSGDGTLGLNLVDDDSIQDTATNSLVGAGIANANGGFTGQVYTIDRAAPTISSMTLTNTSGTTAGKIELDDKVNVTYSEAIRVSSMCSTWTSGDATDQALIANGDVTVTVTDGGASNDTLTVASGTCTLHFGSINLGGTGYATSGNLIFGAGGNGSDRTNINYTASTHTLVIELGIKSGAGTQGTVASSTATLNPDSTLTDSAGNPLTSPFSTNNVQQF